jgi:zinc/manganese transport system substrate-binding protein
MPAFLRFVFLLPALLAVVAAFAWTPSRATAAATPVRVVVTHSLLEDFTRAVAGDHAVVTSLVPRGADPHHFEPRPADVRRLARAELIFVNGLGFDAWAERVIASAGATGRTRVLTEGIAPIACTTPGHDHHDHDHGEADPHAWQDPRLVIRYVENIRAALAANTPELAEEFTARAAAYTAELEKLHAWATEEFARVPAERRVLVTSHDALAYLGRAYGLRIAPIRGAGKSREPSARELAELTAYIREQKAPAVFIETTTNPRLAELLARDAGVRVGEPLFTDSLGEPGGPADTYLNLFRTNVRRIVAALAPETPAPRP